MRFVAFIASSVFLFSVSVCGSVGDESMIDDTNLPVEEEEGSEIGRDYQGIQRNIYEGFQQSVLARTLNSVPWSEYAGKNYMPLAIVIASIILTSTSTVSPSLVSRAINALVETGVPSFLIFEALRHIGDKTSPFYTGKGKNEAVKRRLLIDGASLFATLLTMPGQETMFNALKLAARRLPFLFQLKSMIEPSTKDDAPVAVDEVPPSP